METIDVITDAFKELPMGTRLYTTGFYWAHLLQDKIQPGRAASLVLALRKLPQKQQEMVCSYYETRDITEVKKRHDCSQREVQTALIAYCDSVRETIYSPIDTYWPNLWSIMRHWRRPGPGVASTVPRRQAVSPLVSLQVVAMGIAGALLGVTALYGSQYGWGRWLAYQHTQICLRAGYDSGVDDGDGGTLCTGCYWDGPSHTVVKMTLFPGATFESHLEAGQTRLTPTECKRLMTTPPWKKHGEVSYGPEVETEGAL
jgi:hypothetical protein